MGLCVTTPVAEPPPPSKPEPAAPVPASRPEAEPEGKKQQTAHKLLLLGAGESGKSTLFKQMVNIYGKGFTEQEKRAYVPVIYRNTINAVKQLVKCSEDLPKRNAEMFAGCAIVDEKAKDMARRVIEYKYDDKLKFPPEIIEAIKVLWPDPGIQQTFANRSQFQLLDGTGHFLDTIDNWTRADYLPDTEDVLRCRSRTTGIVESEFLVDEHVFKMVDVGGQRAERKKWMNCFEGVTALVFVAAISEYDQMLFEDEHVKRMDEAFMLFENLCNSRWFKDITVMLFLNKSDIFREKLKKVPLAECFPEYDGDNSYESAVAFMEKEFLKRNHCGKHIYTYVTCATDPHNVEEVFKSAKQTVIRTALEARGMV